MWKWSKEGSDIVLSVNDHGDADYRAEVGRIRKLNSGAWGYALGNRRFEPAASISAAMCSLAATAGLSFPEMMEAFE